jgi:RND family efflux transporter MFP subunit
LRQGEADLSVIEANAALAKATADRWQTLGAGGTVSRQAVDEKTADARAKQAQVTSARANVERLRQLRKFRQVAAPFDGVITSRRVDVGTLVNAGSGAGLELFRMADISKLRVFVQVPQANAGLIHAGISADLKASDHPGRTFKAQVVRNAEAIDPATRTLLVELQTENEDGALFAGAYVEVRFRLAVAERKLSIPMNTLLFRPEGPMVAIVATSEGGDSIELRRVQIGLDYGSAVQIIDGLTATDRLVINPLDSISSGQKVRIAPPTPNKAS